MKKLTVLIALILSSITLTNAQINLSFEAGTKYYKTSVGYQVGKLVPYLGFEIIRGKVSSTYGDRENYGTLMVFMPNLGVKAFLLSKGNVKAGANIGIYKPFVSGKAVADGEEITEYKEMLDSFSSFGGELGIFAEYYFADQFSIGGHFGYRFANLQVKNIEDFDFKTKFSLGGTYTSFVFNFYF